VDHNTGLTLLPLSSHYPAPGTTQSNSTPNAQNNNISSITELVYNLTGLRAEARTQRPVIGLGYTELAVEITVRNTCLSWAPPDATPQVRILPARVKRLLWPRSYYYITLLRESAMKCSTVRATYLSLSYSSASSLNARPARLRGSAKEEYTLLYSTL
jgi:hypothetical protein